MMSAKYIFSARRLTQTGQWLLLAGILLRALIPVGYMLDTTSLERGTSLLIICPTGLEGLVEGTFLEDVFAQHAHHSNIGNGDIETQLLHDDTPCIFAAMAAIAVAFALLGFFLSLWPSIRTWMAPDDEKRANDTALGSLQVRAPPVYS